MGDSNIFMELQDYFSIKYLLRFGYFDFKPSKTNTKNDEYAIFQTFHNKIFTCDSMSLEFSEDLNKLDANFSDTSLDIDTIPIEFTIDKNNDARRIYKMPNMYSYVRLIRHINENRDIYIQIIEKSQKSISKYFYTNSFLENIKIREKCKFGKKYLFKTDIQEFYSSIYTHSIPWVLEGKKVAKKNRDKSEYFNRLDSLVQRCQYGETHGIPTGTFASRIISEVYMCKIDEKLDGYNYVRYVDDFELSYNKDIEQINFYNILSRELRDINLKIKIEKNKKEVFPFKKASNISEIYNFLDENKLKHKEFGKKLSVIHTFIDLCIEKERNGEKGALKNLFIALTQFASNSDSSIIYKTIIFKLVNLVIMKPVLGSYFIDLIDTLNDVKVNNYIKEVLKENKELIEENLRFYIEMNYHQEAYSILSLFYFIDFNDVNESILLDIIKYLDDFNSILSIEIYGNIQKPDWSKLFSTLENKLNDSFSWKDEFWLLKYEIFYKVKNEKDSLFTKEYKIYMHNKYASTEDMNKFFSNEKERKSTKSPIEYLCQKKNDHKQDKNMNIWRFYDTSLKYKVSFLYRNKLTK